MTKFLSKNTILPLLLVLSLATTSPVTIAQSIKQLLQQGNTALDKEQYSQAASIFRVTQGDSENAFAYYKLGVALYQQGKFPLPLYPQLKASL